VGEDHHLVVAKFKMLIS